MSNFIVSARKYRPQRFEDVVGQEHVGQTLKNALKNDHLAHAFLFCGPRGVGKTTCARILAKVLNCQNKTDDCEPCNECDNCKSFDGNSSFNIMELDAASNNSVEHIRTLVEQVRFQPQQGQFKVFIIDEVHMLSQSAFNAFLKTLEEPPSYAIFILATTEKHKIIPTILSRCQIFDFKRIQVPGMVKHLQKICQESGIEAEKDALHIIGQKADGALRDALSIFDRIVSFSGKKITYDDVISNLNILDYDYFFKFTDALVVQDLSKVMLIFDEILKNGFEPDLFINGLGAHFRNLLVCKDQATLKLLEVSDSLKKRYLKQAQLVPANFLLTALNLSNDCDINYKQARDKKLHVELCLIKMAYISQAVELAQQNASIVEKKKTDESDVNSRQPAPSGWAVGKEQPSSTKEESTTFIDPQRDPDVVAEPPHPEHQKPPAESASEQEVKTAATPEAAAEVEEAAHSLRNHSKLGTRKILSLDEMDDEIEENEPSSEALENQALELTQEAVGKAWKAFIDTINQMTTKTIFNSASIKIEKGELVVTAGSTLAVNTIRQEGSMMDFLREKLNAPQLLLNIKVDPEKALAKQLPKKAKPMTDSEKYWKMKEQNPLMDEMRKRFDLKFDQE